MSKDTPRSVPATKEPVSGPVPMHHRLKLGEDVVTNPQGDGAPAPQTVGSSLRKGW